MENNQTSPEKGKRKNGLWNIGAVPILVAGAIFALQYIIKNPRLVLCQCFMDMVPKTWDFENKVYLLSTLAAWISIYIMINSSFVMLTRIFTLSPNPVKYQDSLLINLFNRTLTNSIEQTLVFFPLLVCWTFKKSNESNSYEVILFGYLFIIGRIFFFIGYGLGQFIKLPTLRGFGFALGYGLSAALALRLINYPIL